MGNEKKGIEEGGMGKKKEREKERKGGNNGGIKERGKEGVSSFIL